LKTPATTEKWKKLKVGRKAARRSTKWPVKGPKVGNAGKKKRKRKKVLAHGGA